MAKTKIPVKCVFCGAHALLGFPDDGICATCRRWGVTMQDIFDRTLDGSLHAIMRPQVFTNVSSILFSPRIERNALTPGNGNSRFVVFDIIEDGDVTDTRDDPLNDPDFIDIDQGDKYLAFAIDEDQARLILKGELIAVNPESSRAYRDHTNLTYSGIHAH